MFYTYAHYKPDNSIFYIGKGKEYRAYRLDGRNDHWKNIVKKHGSFNVELLAHWKTEQEAFEHEKFLIWCFRDMGYSIANLTDGGDGISGYKHTEETKANIRKTLAENPMPADSLEKIRQGRLGTKHSEETKKQISESAKKRPAISPETRQKMSEAQKGKKKLKPGYWFGKNMSEETKKKISESLKGISRSKKRTGWHHSEETRKKMSESAKAYLMRKQQTAKKEV